MSPPGTPRVITSRIVRDGTARNDDEEWLDHTPSERMEAVWTLTRLCYGWGQTGNNPDELRLQRTVTRVQRGRG